MTRQANRAEAAVWLRMGDEDRERYGGPEWVTFPVGALIHTPSSQLEAWEAETGIPLFLVLHELPTYGSRATRAALFIARRLAGEADTWDKFDPCTLLVKRREQPPAAAQDGAGQGKAQRPKAATSRRGSAAARSGKSSTTSAQS